MIKVSTTAKEYIDKLMVEQNPGNGAFLRVGVRGGGCSGLEYQMSFDTQKKESDQEAVFQQSQCFQDL